jgi:hypothetical protein
MGAKRYEPSKYERFISDNLMDKQTIKELLESAREFDKKYNAEPEIVADEEGGDA